MNFYDVLDFYYVKLKGLSNFVLTYKILIFVYPVTDHPELSLLLRNTLYHKV